MKDNIKLQRERKDPTFPQLAAEGIELPDDGRGVPLRSAERSPVTTVEPTHRSFEVSIRLNASLQEVLRNMVEAPIEAGDYSQFTSVPDIIRCALHGHTKGMRLTEKTAAGPKKRFTIALNASLKAYYDSLPERRKSEIIERAVRSYLKEHTLYQSLRSSSE